MRLIGRRPVAVILILLSSIYLQTIARGAQQKDASACVGGLVSRVTLNTHRLPGRPNGIVIIDDRSIADGGRSLSRQAIIENEDEKVVSLSGTEARVFSIGPWLTILDRYDDISVKTTCTAQGIKLTAYINRQGEVNPTLRSNSGWIPPTLAFNLTTHEPVIDIEVDWILHSTVDNTDREWSMNKIIKH